MPFNGTGTFVRLENWTNDANANLPISATKFDIEDNDFASGFGLCLTRDGQGTPSGPLTWTQALTIAKASDGTAFTVIRSGGANNPGLQVQLTDASSLVTLNQPLAAGGLAIAVNGVVGATFIGAQQQQQVGTAPLPSYSFTGDPNTGLYWIGADDLGIAVGGVVVGDFGVNTHNFWNTSVAAQCNFQLTNTNTVAGNDIRLVLNAGSSSVALFCTNQNGTATITGGAATAAATLRTLGTTMPLQFGTNNILRASVDGNGRWVFAAPSITGSSAYTFNGINTNNSMLIQAGAGAGGAFGLAINAGTNTADYALQVKDQSNTTIYFRILGTGEAYTLAPTTATSPPAGTFQIGFLDVPQNIQNAAYGFVLSDRGKHVYHTSGSAHVYTIPANASVAFPIGTTISIVNELGAGVVTLNITTDTLEWFPSGTVGSGRTLAVNSLATILKVTATKWVLTGVGIS